MKTIAQIIAISTVTAVLVSSVFMFAGESEPAKEPASQTGADPRIAALEKKIADLERRLDSGAAPAPATRVIKQGGVAPKVAVAQLRDDAKAAEEVVLGVLDSGDPEVANKVQDMVRDQLEIAREERFNDRITMRQARIKERIDKLSDENNLPGEVRQELKSLLVAEHASRMALVREGRETMRWEGVREKINAQREKTDTEVEEMLDGDALAEYQDWRESTRWGPRRGGQSQKKKEDNKTPAPSR